MLTYRDVIAGIVGAAIAAIAAIAVMAAQQPQSFEECFLRESKGRSDKALSVVASYCQKKFTPAE